jgi:hypothetical protein
MHALCETATPDTLSFVDIRFIVYKKSLSSSSNNNNNNNNNTLHSPAMSRTVGNTSRISASNGVTEPRGVAAFTVWGHAMMPGT